MCVCVCLCVLLLSLMEEEVRPAVVKWRGAADRYIRLTYIHKYIHTFIHLIYTHTYKWFYRTQSLI